MNSRFLSRAVASAALILLAENAPATPPASEQETANRIAGEIEQIRGIKFKQPVRVESQSVDDFGQYVSREIDTAVPKPIRENYGAIVRTLGLYKGPPIDDFSSLMTSVMTSQVGAYYDPEKRAFFVVMSNMPELMQGVLYSHELYHALQDQYFDLTRYMEMGEKPGETGASRAHDSDVRLARSAVVEGEATYMMSLWAVQKMAGQQPTRAVMSQVVNLQSNISMDKLREALKEPRIAEAVGSDVQKSVDAARDIPAFIIDSMMGVYFKGMGFVFAVQEQGWPAVEKLYGEYPPQSTEHILHPEKWLAREAPVSFEWPHFEKIAALRDWELLDDDVLGEFQWRIVFREHGLAAEAESVAAGWGGDRYAVFKSRNSQATLLLMRTSWDSERDAKEFADAYKRVWSSKYGNPSVPTLLEQSGVDVFIVEGGDEKNIAALMKVVKRAKQKRS